MQTMLHVLAVLLLRIIVSNANVFCHGFDFYDNPMGIVDFKAHNPNDDDNHVHRVEFHAMNQEQNFVLIIATKATWAHGFVLDHVVVMDNDGIQSYPNSKAAGPWMTSYSVKFSLGGLCEATYHEIGFDYAENQMFPRWGIFSDTIDGEKVLEFTRPRQSADIVMQIT